MLAYGIIVELTVVSSIKGLHNTSQGKKKYIDKIEI